MSATTSLNTAEPMVKNAERQARFFEALHQREVEPWSFSARGAEVLRHDLIAAWACSLGPWRVVDVGCSLGQLTHRLAQFAPELLAIDISPTAVGVARKRCAAQRPGFIAGVAVALPLPSGTVDLTIACDGIYSWNLDLEERAIALQELRRITRPGGHVLLTDHMRRSRFADFVREIEHSGLRIEQVTYLYDRPWYQVESWFKAVQRTTVVQAARRSVRIARSLRAMGRMIGPGASRHICVLARHDS